MLLNYGHAKISYQGESYVLSPCFSNIAKLGKPTEIIDLFKRFIMLDASVSKWHIALNILEACCDKELPSSLVGCTVFSTKQNKFMYRQPAHGLPMFDDCIILAEHCLKHGICGDVDHDNDDSDSSSPIQEFDAYYFIEMAMEHLKVSRDEAGTMTMTEFSRRMSVKFPSQSKKDKVANNEKRELQEWFEQQNKGVH